VALEGVVEAAVGFAHATAVRADGSVWAWGSNSEGQVGDGAATSRTSPIRLLEPPGAINVAAGGAHTIALDAEGQVWTWGSNSSGQLGDGLGIQRATPAALAGLSLADGGWLGEDPDADGLSTALELLLASDPYDSDSNDDGLPDGVAAGQGVSLTSADVDGDGLENAAELAAGTSPFDADTDGDGVPDGTDAFPLDPTQTQLTTTPGDTTAPSITVTQPTDAVRIS
jgi:hypothetical protein